jgi:hypothetical protein
MSCKQFDSQIHDYATGVFSASGTLENHLETCEECRKKVEDVRHAMKVFSAWKDEEITPWNRAPVGFFNPRPARFWWRWGPSLAAILLFALVLFNTEIKITPEGTTIRFASRDTGSELPPEFLEQMKQQDKELETSIATMLKQFQINQDVQLQELIRYAIENHRRDISRDLENLNQQWETRRKTDNAYWNNQINRVYNHTNQNYDHLTMLADLIVKNP